MKNTFLSSLCFLVIFSFFPNIKANSEVIFRGQTQDEAFSFVMELVKALPGLSASGYTVPLPMHKDFEVIYKNPALFEQQDMSSFRRTFDEEVYDASKFDTRLEIIRQTEDVVKKALQKLTVLQANWGFKLKQKYDIIVALYGPGGSYGWTDETGTVLITMDEQWAVKSKARYAQTIVHEMVHIGIEEAIVRKYNLSHWEKERLVDLVCSLYLKDLLPGYENQDGMDTTIDSFITEKTILASLPAAVEAFVGHYPRK